MKLVTKGNINKIIFKKKDLHDVLNNGNGNGRLVLTTVFEETKMTISFYRNIMMIEWNACLAWVPK